MWKIRKNQFCREMWGKQRNEQKHQGRTVTTTKRTLKGRKFMKTK